MVNRCVCLFQTRRFRWNENGSTSCCAICQNIMLTISANEQCEIEAEFRDTSSKVQIKKEIFKELPEETYSWINYLGGTFSITHDNTKRSLIWSVLTLRGQEFSLCISKDFSDEEYQHEIRQRRVNEEYITVDLAELTYETRHDSMNFLDET